MHARETLNRRIAELKEVGSQIKALLNDTHDVIKLFCSELDSGFGMDEVNAPARLVDIMPTAIPTNQVELERIIGTIRLQILYDTGMELDRLRKPLRDMEIAFDELDLDQYLRFVKGEESLKDRLEDEYNAFTTALLAVVNRISDQGIAINHQRTFFGKALDDANHGSKMRRARMDEGILKARRDPQMQLDGKTWQECLESVVGEALKGRELHDLHLRTAFFRHIRGFLLPIAAKPAFDIFERLDGCADYARLKKGS